MLVYALHVPIDDQLLPEHKKSFRLFESIIDGRNDLLITSTIAIEVSIVLSRIIGSRVGKEGFERLTSVSKEIYPFSSDTRKNIFYTATSNIYFDQCIENAFRLGRILKDPKDKKVPGWNKRKTEVLLSGMDIFVISYAKLKNACIISNDWSLWYSAWKLGLDAYWMKGLSDKDISKLCRGDRIEYPKV